MVNITCDKLQCGKRPSSVPNELRNRLESRRDIALHGDWPWMVALYKNGLHVCDATLIEDQWVMTTASCFQGLVFDDIFPLLLCSGVKGTTYMCAIRR